MKYKTIFSAIIFSISSVFVALFGPWNTAIQTLIICMGIDYITGLILAAVFKKSKKSKSGGLSSLAGWKGIARKGITLLIVLIANRLDIMLNVVYIRDAVIIAFTVNEILSIIENAAVMGIPIPDVIKKAIDLLKNKEIEQ